MEEKEILELMVLELIEGQPNLLQFIRKEKERFNMLLLTNRMKELISSWINHITRSKRHENSR
jgi:hypothetical protein